MSARPALPGSTQAAWLWPGLALLAATLLLFSKTGAELVALWSRSETFTHAFLVPPISLWLVWRQRAVLATLTPRPVPWLLAALSAGCLLWLVGELAFVAAASQFALVTLIVLAVPALYGWQITRQLLFPLGFLYFSVPFGEFMVPQLMEWTADFTVLAVAASGVPVYREGLQFVIPSGNWSVVEACSGVRYLIASVMVGTLFAYLNYSTMRRRLIFVAVAFLVPVLANWLRAYMIVMIGHLSNNELAAGVDHLVYGWVFFGLVIGLMFWVGARWADAPAPAAPDGTLAAAPVAGGVARLWVVAACAVVLLAGTQALKWRLVAGTDAPVPKLQLPAALSDGWTASADWTADWKPGFRNPSASAAQAYVQAAAPGTPTVWVWVGLYSHQGPERKLVSSTNGFVEPTDTGWNEVSRALRDTSSASGTLRVRAAELRGSATPNVTQAPRLRVWRVYRIGDRYTASDVQAKLLQALRQLTGQGDDGAVLVLATPMQETADAVLDTFARGPLDTIARAATAALGAPPTHDSK